MHSLLTGKKSGKCIKSLQFCFPSCVILGKRQTSSIRPLFRPLQRKVERILYLTNEMKLILLPRNICAVSVNKRFLSFDMLTGMHYISPPDDRILYFKNVFIVDNECITLQRIFGPEVLWLVFFRVFSTKSILFHGR